MKTSTYQLNKFALWNRRTMFHKPECPHKFERKLTPVSLNQFMSKHTHTHTHTHTPNTQRKITLWRLVSTKSGDTPTFFKTTPPIFWTPPFLWEEKSEPLFFFSKILKTLTLPRKPSPFIRQGVGVSTMLKLFEVRKGTFTDWKIAVTLSL